jgi:hypothetical protein
MRNFYTHDFDQKILALGATLKGIITCRVCKHREEVFVVLVSHEYKGTPEQNAWLWETEFNEIPKIPSCNSVIVKGVLRA